MVASLDMKMRFACGEHAANVCGHHHVHMRKILRGLIVSLFFFKCFLKRYERENFMSQKAYYLYVYL